DPPRRLASVVRHDRHYTLEQANAARDWVTDRVHWIRDARASLVALGPRGADAVATLEPESGGSYPGRDVARSLVALSRASGRLPREPGRSVGLDLVECLVLEQRGHKRIEIGAVVLQQLRDLAVRRLDDPSDLGVDDALRFL